jgi:hypothetical protein
VSVVESPDSYEVELCDLLLLGAFFDVFDDLADRLEFFGVFIRHFGSPRRA